MITRMLRLLPCLAALMVFNFPIPTHAGPVGGPRTLNVPSVYPNIQAGVDAAFSSSDTVLVADGTYTGPGNRDIDFHGKNITVTSQNGPTKTIIDCGGYASTDGSGNHRGFYVHSGETDATVSGFTVKNGYETYISSSPNSGYGGGIFNSNTNSGTIALTNCTIINSTAQFGGGVYNANSGGTTMLTNCTITTNNAQGFSSSGGGISNENSGGTITLTNCTITANTAQGKFSNSGGVSNDNKGGGTITLTNCTITANTVGSAAARTAGGGGGVSNGNSGGAITLTNCTITANTVWGFSVGSGGGGVYNSGGNGTIALTNCTLTANTIQGNFSSGGGVLNDNYGGYITTLTNDVIYGDTGGEVFTYSGTTPAIVNYCDVQGGSSGTGNINADPQFVNTANGDLHLKPGSPCLGKGTPNGAPATDKDGNTRPSTPSMGAYDSGDSSASSFPSFNGLHAYFANLHSHTNDSDGEPLASPDDAFAEGKSNGLDIMAVTDHAELLTPHAYSGSLPTWDILIPVDISASDLNKWNSILNSANNINVTSSGSFLGLRGFEWSADGGQANSYDAFGLFPLPVVPSSTENIGHINVIGSSNYVAHHYVDPSQAQYQITSLNGLFNWVDSQIKTDPNMVCEFNHPNTYSSFPFNGVYNYPVEAFPAGVKQAFSLIELSGHSKYFGSFLEPEEIYNGTTNLTIWQAALKNDWRLAPVLNEDNHTAEYGKEKYGRTGVWAKSLSQGDVLQAIRARHVYATRDHTLVLKFWLEDTSGNTLGIMGDTLSARPSSIVPRVQTAGSGVSEVRLFAVTASSPIPLGNSAGTVLSYNINTDEFSPTVIPTSLPSDVICYYVRVDLGNGLLAFSAPIWINPTIASNHTHILWNNADGRVMLWSIAQDGTFTLNGFGPYTDGAPQNVWHATAVATGPDGKSHLLWNNTDGRVMLWTVDDTGIFTLAGYGPYTDNAPGNLWTATAVSVGADNVVHLLWNNTDNRVMLWNVAQDFSFTLAGFGPYTDNAPQNKWRATALATGPDNVSRIVWNNTDSRVMLWKVDSAFNFTLAGYGPYTDGAPQNVWSAAGVSVGPDNLTHLLWSNTDRRAMFWNVDSAFGFTLAGFGPYTDDTPQHLWYAGAVATGPDGLNHVLWDNTDYRAMLWGVDNSFGFTVAGYGPYTDNAPGNLWTATAISAGP